MDAVIGSELKISLRQLQLKDWVNTQVKGCGALLPLTGDAGFRRYYRLQGLPGLLAVDAPPATEDTSQFIKVSSLMVEHGVTVPRIIAADSTVGFLLVEDWGQLLLGNAPACDLDSTLYQKALMALLKIQRIPVQKAELPLFDATSIRRELSFFPEWFLSGLMGYELSTEEFAMLDLTFELIEQSALTQPQTVVHRDFHSRNILVGDDSQLALIDFQDAVVGPFTYDLASLLRDCYVRLPVEQVECWALEYGDKLMSEGVIPRVPKEQYLRWFDYIGLQRHIKVLGVFARLHLRDGKSGYLKDLPLVIDYVVSVATKYPELQAFGSWFGSVIVPLCEEHEWYAG